MKIGRVMGVARNPASKTENDTLVYATSDHLWKDFEKHGLPFLLVLCKMVQIELGSLGVDPRTINWHFNTYETTQEIP